MTSTYDNLDLSELQVEAPAAGKLYALTCFYEYSHTDPADIVERFCIKVKEHYGLSELDEGAIYCGIYFDPSTGTKWYPYSEVKDDLEGQNIMFMKYEDEEHFFLYYVHSMAEWFDVPLLQKQIGLTDYSDFGWRPYDLYESVGMTQPAAVYRGKDLQSAKIAYPVMGGEMTLQEASAMIAERLTPGFCALPEFFTLKLDSIQVYPLGADLYGYWGESTFYYEGVPLSDVPGGDVLGTNDPRFTLGGETAEGEYHDIYQGSADAFILSRDGVAWAWLSNTFDGCRVEDTYGKAITLDSALRQVSDAIAGRFVPQILSAKLVYVTDRVYEDYDAYLNHEDYEVQLFPAWQLAVGDTGASEYQEMTIYVDAVTGTVTFYGL